MMVVMLLLIAVPVDLFEVVLAELHTIQGALALPRLQIHCDALHAEHVAARKNALLQVLFANRAQHVSF